MYATVSSASKVFRLDASGQQPGRLGQFECDGGHQAVSGPFGTILCDRLAAGEFAEVAGSASSPRKMFHKDILRVGCWETATGVWHVTSDTLRRLIANWRLARRRGVRIPVVWNHSHDARDQIGEIAQLYLIGETLYCLFWAADPQDLRKLGVTVNEVSVEVHQPWADGAGNRYDIMLTHLGVVNLPVVNQQKPFQRLRNSRQGERSMSSADRAHTDDQANADYEEPALDLARLIPLINQLLQAAGVPEMLEEETTADSLVDRLAELVASLPESDEEPAPAEPKDRRSETAKLRLELQETKKRLVRQRCQSQERQRRAFVASLDRLVGEGRVSPASRATLLEAAHSADYSLSLLEPFDSIPAGSAIPLKRISRLGATSLPPHLNGARSPMTADRAKQIARSFVTAE